MVRTAAVAALSLAALAGSAHGVFYFDGTFTPSDWSSVTLTNLSGVGSSVNAVQNLSGGNPNEWRETQNTLVVGSGTGEVIGVHLSNVSFYNPSTQGAVTAINYSEDAINLIDDRIVPGAGQATGLAIFQGGKYFVLRPPSSMPYSGFSTWQNISRPGIVASDMWEYSFPGGLNAFSNPDFSNAGTVMQLGYYRGNSGNGGYSTDCGIDNWHVEIVPTPGAGVLLGMGMLCGARRRRR